MKVKNLRLVDNHLKTSVKLLQWIKREDIRARKKAKASRKPHWTRAISATTKSIEALIAVRQVVKKIPKRV